MLNKSEPPVAIKIRYNLVIIDPNYPNSRTRPKVGEAEFHFGNVREHKLTHIRSAYHLCDEHSQIKIMGEITEISHEPKPPHSCSLGDDLSLLLKDTKFSDVELVSCDKRRFRAHTCILAARSTVFSCMFENDMTEKKSGVVEIDDVDGEILQRLLDYVYSGRFDEEEETTKTQQLLIAAEKYAIDRLKASCEESLVKRMSVETAVYDLVLADDHNAQKLKEKALEFIDEHSKEMFELPEFLELQTSRPKLAIELLRRKWPWKMCWYFL